MNIHTTIMQRLERIDWSAYRLVQATQGKVTDRVIYSFLAGRSRINSEALGEVLEAIGGRIIFDKRPPQ